jgi:hypothetical protein
VLRTRTVAACSTALDHRVMNIVIRDSSLGLSYYWKKSVTGGPGRPCQNDRFIAVINSHERSALASENYRHWHQNKNSRLITGGYTTAVIQIPIVFRNPEIPCLRPAVSSLGACPTPAR